MTNKILISGYYGFDNFGDEIILSILTENIKKYIQDAVITVFSASPEKTAANLNVRSIYSFNYFKVIKEIIKCNTLISGGGSLLQDTTSSKSLIYYLGIIFLAALFRKKIIIFAQGFGPVNNKFLLKITGFILKHAKYITIRDDNSINRLKEIGINAEKCFDPVWNINIKDINQENKLGIQLRNTPCLNDDILNKLAAAISKYYSDKKITLLSLQNQQDLNICRKFKEKIKEINNNIDVEITENTSNEKIIEEISKCDEIIAMRYHACLIAIKCGIKLLPLSYDIKVETLAEDFHLDYIELKNNENIEEKIKDFRNVEINYNEEYIKSIKYDFQKLTLELNN